MMARGEVQIKKRGPDVEDQKIEGGRKEKAIRGSVKRSGRLQDVG
jgi:hypothetical protein